MARNHKRATGLLGCGSVARGHRATGVAAPLLNGVHPEGPSCEPPGQMLLPGGCCCLSRSYSIRGLTRLPGLTAPDLAGGTREGG